jgi:hypothetical protein
MRISSKTQKKTPSALQNINKLKINLPLINRAIYWTLFSHYKLKRLTQQENSTTLKKWNLTMISFKKFWRKRNLLLISSLNMFMKFLQKINLFLLVSVKRIKERRNKLSQMDRQAKYNPYKYEISMRECIGSKYSAELITWLLL